jgi:hypothetical protein
MPARLAPPSAADISECLALLEATPQRLARFARGSSDARLAKAPDPETWSPVEVLAHLRGCDEVWVHTILAMLTEDEPAMPVYDPRRFARAAGFARQPFSTSLQAFALRRAEFVSVLGALAPGQWQRTAKLGNKLFTVFIQARRLALHEVVHCDELDSRLK